MKRAATPPILLILVTSSLVGAIGLSLASPSSRQWVILSPLQFQLNGSDPYTIKVPMTPSETISGEINATGGAVTFSVVFQGVVMQAEPVSWSYHFTFTATSQGTYELTFASSEATTVSVSVYSP